MENEYVIKVYFLDEDGFLIESEYMTVTANSNDEAYEKLENEIFSNLELYPSTDYDTKLIDVH